MDLSIITSRRSIRRFSPRAVSKDVIEKLLEAAVCAPSAHNRQPWRFVVLSSEELRFRLAQTMAEEFRRDLQSDGLAPAEVEAQVKRSIDRIVSAPVAIVVCLDLSEVERFPDERRQRAEYLMAVQSVAMAGENLLLAIQEEGLGGVWMCAPLFVPEVVQQVLDLSQTWQAQGLILLGYPAEIPPARARRPITEVTRFL
jgi:F420 biosynthesis protein FbiB-like protein